MTRYRIIRRAGLLHPLEAFYDVERRVLWWWERVGIAFLTIEAAKARIQELKEEEANPIKRQVVYQEP